MKHIGWITYNALPAMAEDERDLPAMLLNYAIQVTPLVWDAKDVDYTAFDACIFRSPWDYFQRSAEFSAWLNLLQQQGIKTYNSIDILRVNMDKNYLLTLKQKGVSICESVIIKKNTSVLLKHIAEKYDWAEMVMKPTVSGTAFQTYRFTSSDCEKYDPILTALLQEKDMILQPFIPEIETVGEVSLIYFNKKFSHAVLKQVQQGDFRVQQEFGGSVQLYKAGIEDIEFGNFILDKINEPLLYARVDFVKSNNKHLLMELELFETSLYLVDIHAKNNFVRAICNIV